MSDPPSEHPPVQSKSSKGKSEDNPEVRPPATRRVRKAINCEPCRHSKLKCDRNRPCSSCVLRGTAAMCYQGVNGKPPLPTPEDKHLDPGKEFALIRHSLSMLETRYFPAVRNSKGQPKAQSTTPGPKQEDNDTVDVPELNAPGMLGMQGKSGFYTGPTSAASHLVVDDPTLCPEDHTNALPRHDYDSDLLDLLPPMHAIDTLVDYYFEYCNWTYRHVDQATFLPAWQKYKSGQSPDRLIFATAGILVSLAILYLPLGHQLLSILPVSPDEATYLQLSLQCYNAAKTALRRHQDGTHAYSLELVELLLASGHYLTYSKKDTEEIWSVTGELMTIGIAMGLHRDPGRSKFSPVVAERRRWAWWHIHLFESWQAFMFGRPMATAPHHFNTRFPTYCDPELDPSGRLFLPNIALFELSSILGEIMDDAVSFRPVPYESTLAKDRLLASWLGSLPPGIDLDECHIVKNLSSPDISVRRFGVQSIVLLSSHYHMRFTLHRSHAGSTKDSSTASHSFKIAVASAKKLISLAAQTSSGFLALDQGVALNAPPHVHGHLNWRPFHVFSAAMFFTFQLIRRPDQPEAESLRSCVRKSVQILDSELSQNVIVAQKSLTVLLTLARLYSEEYLALDAPGRENEKCKILAIVDTLPFPYQDPPVGKARSSSSIVAAAYIYPDVASGNINRRFCKYDSSSTSLAQCGERSEGSSIYMAPISTPLSVPSTRSGPGSTVPIPPSPPGTAYASGSGCGASQSYSLELQSNANLYVSATDDWGGAVGFGPGEWLGFMDGLQQQTGAGF